MATYQTTQPGSSLSSAIPPATGSNSLNVGTAERVISVLAGVTLSWVAYRNYKRYHNLSSTISLGVAALGLIKRGVTGFCEVNQLINRNTANRKSSAMEAEVTVTVDKSPREVFSFWRDFENLPQFMEHLKTVEVLDERRSSWTAKLPGGVGQVSWEAVIEDETDDERIAWSSLPGSTIDNAGEVTFSEGASGQTVVNMKISYRLPAGAVGGAAGKLFNPLVEKMIQGDLERFKEAIEKKETLWATSAHGGKKRKNSGATSSNL